MATDRLRGHSERERRALAVTREKDNFRRAFKTKEELQPREDVQQHDGEHDDDKNDRDVVLHGVFAAHFDHLQPRWPSNACKKEA